MIKMNIVLFITCCTEVAAAVPVTAFTPPDFHVVGWSSVWDFLRYHKCGKCQTLHDGTME